MAELRFRTEKVSERITRIYAFSSELMYFVEGDNEAVLIDSGSGSNGCLQIFDGIVLWQIIRYNFS